MTCVVASPGGGVLLAAWGAARRPSHAEHGAKPCFPGVSLSWRTIGLFTRV